MSHYEKKVREYNSVLQTVVQVLPNLNNSQKEAAQMQLQAMEAQLQTAPIKVFDSGVALNGMPNTGDTIMWIDSQTTSSGQVTFHVTSNRTAGGTPICSQISSNSVDVVAIDSTGMYARGNPSITNNKTITVPMTKETFSGVNLLGVDVLAVRTMGNTPGGVTVKLFVIGTSV